MMTLYVNKKGEVKDVGTTTDKTLTALAINDEGNPFADWPVALICCYRVRVEEGQVVMYTPRVDTRIIEHIAKLGKADTALSGSVTDAEVAIAETYEQGAATADAVTNLELALAEVYETILGGI